MMMSPASMAAAIRSTVEPVYAAGTITQAARGDANLETKSSTLDEPVAPSASSALRASSLTS